MMNIAAFSLLAFMLLMYVIFDGYDLGVATISPLIARGRDDRNAILTAIGPFWGANEVWLIAGGAALFALFPKAFASSFSGFYLPFIVVLWLLMIRGVAIELRNHIDGTLWRDFWDVAFTASSALLIVLFGVAFGNVLRGVPLDRHDYFVGTFGSLLNPYALGVAGLAVAALAQHGLLYAAMRTPAELAGRALKVAERGWFAVLGFYLLITATTFFMTVHGSAPRPLAVGCVVLSVIALVFERRAVGRGSAREGFRCSIIFLASLFIAAAQTLYPYLIPNLPLGTGGIRVDDASPTPQALLLTMSIVCLGLVALAIYRTLAAKSIGLRRS